MKQPAPGNRDFGKTEPKAGLDPRDGWVDRWLSRWLKLLGVMIGLCLWLLVVEKLVLALTH